MATVEVKAPDIGDFESVDVIELLVQVGDTIKVEQSLITVESDKASMEIPSSHAGVIKEMRVKLGDKVAEGSLLLVLETSDVPAAAAPPVAPAPPPAEAVPAVSEPAVVAASAPSVAVASVAAPAPAAPSVAQPAHEPSAPTAALPHASPAIRKMARELGVPLGEVTGSAPKGRITQKDLQGFVARVMAGTATTRAAAAAAPASGGAMPGLLPWPQVDFAKFGAVERRDLTRIQKIRGDSRRSF
jgi:pyruvate dehydrogenase E2 component (dihydrolipoamide acetyltransferase)